MSKPTFNLKGCFLFSDNFLKTLLDDDFQAGEPDIGDFISSHSSAFEQLFLQEKNMEVSSLLYAHI